MHGLILWGFLVHLCCMQIASSQSDRERKGASWVMDDGVKRVVKLKRNNIDSYLKKSKIMGVLFYSGSKEDPTGEKTWKGDEQMLEMAARILQPQGVVIGIMDVSENVNLVQKIGVRYSGCIMLFHKGKVVEYLGHRSAEVFLTFIHKLFDPPVTLVETKTQKKNFEDVDSAKVIVFIEKGSPELKEIEGAGAFFQPSIPFHVVHDKKLAKSMRFKKPGSIQLMKPYEKPIWFPAGQAISENTVVKFVEENKKQILTKIKMEDIHSSWSAHKDGYLVASFVSLNTDDGSKFFSLVKTLARQYGTLDALHFVWIDPGPYPMLRSFWQSSYNIDISKPTIGVIEVKSNKSSWFEYTKEPTLKMLQNWVEQVLARKVEFREPKQQQTTEQAGSQSDEEQEIEKDEL